MCQMNVFFEQDGKQEKVLENATLLEVTPEGVRVSTFFEEPKMVAESHVSKIDFLKGTVILEKNERARS